MITSRLCRSIMLGLFVASSTSCTETHKTDSELLQTLILRAKKYGFRRFYISVNFMAEKIEEHIANEIYKGLDIKLIYEDKPLGTAGSLSLVPDEITDPIVVCNGDIITTMPFDRLLEHHKEMKNDATAVVRPMQVMIPYGVVELVNERITSIVEKPEKTYLINSGMYVIDPKILRLLKKNEKCDMPELIEHAIQMKYSVGACFMHEYWADIGGPEDYRKAHQSFESNFNKGELV